MAVEEDVSWLYVAVHDALGVGNSKGANDLYD